MSHVTGGPCGRRRAKPPPTRQRSPKSRGANTRSRSAFHIHPEYICMRGRVAAHTRTCTRSRPKRTMSLASLANISFAKLRIDAPASKRKPAASSGHFGERSDSAQMAVKLIALSRVLLTKDAAVLSTVAASAHGAELLRIMQISSEEGRQTLISACGGTMERGVADDEIQDGKGDEECAGECDDGTSGRISNSISE